MRKLLIVSLGLLVCAGLGGLAVRAQEGGDGIDAREIMATARFLASDALGGREYGSAEGKIAALYVASRFDAIGLAPGEKGYLQPLEKGQNVLARLAGSDPERSGEAILVGAHIDHLGRKRRGIYNGADDNASGIAVLLAVAQALKKGPPLARTLIFAAFDGEEQGLVGSRHYAEDPLVPLDETVLMVNLDMVGRNAADLFPKFLFVLGTEHCPEVRDALEKANADGPGFRVLPFSVSLLDTAWASSDHKPFWEAKVPILYLTTGPHRNYHMTSDDSEWLLPEKMAKIASLVTEVIRSVDRTREPPAFQEYAENLGADDRKSVRAILAPALQLGPMMGLEPERIARLKEIDALLEDEEREWTKEEVKEVAEEIRSLIYHIGRRAR